MMISFCLFWAQDTLTISSLPGVPFPYSISLLPQARSLLATLSRVQFYAVLALPLMLWRAPKRLQVPKAISYLAYPGHLLVIGVIRHFLM